MGPKNELLILREEDVFAVEKYVGKPIRGPTIKEGSSDLSEPILKSMGCCYILVLTRLDDQEPMFLFLGENVSEKGEEGKEMSGFAKKWLLWMWICIKTKHHLIRPYFVVFPDGDL